MEITSSSGNELMIGVYILQPRSMAIIFGTCNIQLFWGKYSLNTGIIVAIEQNASMQQGVATPCMQEMTCGSYKLRKSHY